MNIRRCLTVAALVFASVVFVGPPTAAQMTTPPRPILQPTDPTAPTAQPVREPSAVDRFEQEFGVRRRYWRPVLRIGQDFTLRANETVRSVTVVFGSARIDGRVEGDLVVIFGPVTLASTAVVEGAFVVVGGQATVEPGAMVRDEVVAVGAGLDVPDNFYFGGGHVVIGTQALGAWMDSIVPWITRGVLLGRPFVPSIGWVWSVLGVFFVVYLMLNLLGHGPVTETASVLASRPFGSFMTGLLVLLLAGPVSALLAVSIIGIAVIPFGLAALVVAGFVGRVGVLRAIGNTVLPPEEPGDRLLGLRSFLIGFVVVTLVYWVPVLGLMAWALLGVLGLGAAVLAFLAAWRREYPRQERPARGPKVAPPPVPPPPAPAPPPPPEPAGGYAYSTPAEPVRAQSPGFGSGPATFAGPGADAGHQAEVPAGAIPLGGGVAAMPHGAASELLSFPRATFLDRAAALLIDVVLVMFIAQVLHPMFFYRGDNFSLAMLLIYFIAFWTWKGTSIGGIVVNLRVVRVDGGELTFLEALVRGLTGVLAFGALGIGVLWILRNDIVAGDGLPARQGWHDVAAGTYVVKVPKGYPLP